MSYQIDIMYTLPSICYCFLVKSEENILQEIWEYLLLSWVVVVVLRGTAQRVIPQNGTQEEKKGCARAPSVHSTNPISLHWGRREYHQLNLAFSKPSSGKQPLQRDTHVFVLTKNWRWDERPAVEFLEDAGNMWPSNLQLWEYLTQFNRRGHPSSLSCKDVLRTCCLQQVLWRSVLFNPLQFKNYIFL